MSKIKPTYEELQTRLAAAEPIVDALKHHEVDAVVGAEKIAFLLLKEVREALVNSEAAFRAVFDLSGIGMFQADPPAFRFTRVNQKFCEMTGYSAEELLTKTYIAMTHPQDRRRDMDELARVLQAKINSWSIKKRCLRKDGGVISVRIDGAALRGVAGTVIRILAMISDGTSQNHVGRSARKGKVSRLKRPAAKKLRLKRR